MKIIHEAPGYSIPFERKGRRFTMQVTVPKEPNEWQKQKKQPAKQKRVTFAPTKISKNPFDTDEMDVDSLFIGQAIRG